MIGDPFSSCYGRAHIYNAMANKANELIFQENLILQQTFNRLGNCPHIPYVCARLSIALANVKDLCMVRIQICQVRY